MNNKDNDITDDDFDTIKKTGYNLLGKISQAKENAVNDKLAKSMEEWTTFIKYITNNFGIFITRNDKGLVFYKRARLTPEAEKKRTLVLNQIKNAVKDIKQNLPSLGKHLEKSIFTGAKCSYKPEEPIEWFIHW